ncbi:MAG: cobalamin biosynthesis protein [Actinobacteria bacterium]|nr:cobalamin biosynthesis protein [Actinomycetota bacterium]
MTRAWRALGILAGYLGDVVLRDPRRGHPVAGFGSAAASLERVSYRDHRTAGAVHVAILLAAVAAAVLPVRRSTPALAAATWACLGGTSLSRTGLAMAELLDAGDLDAARALLPSLCGRDPATLDGAGLARAALESIAENTSDAAVAPLMWAAAGGAPGVCVYRAINTLDAMIGYRSPRYARFGWAAARIDDAANYLPARLTGVLTVACAALVGGSPAGALRAWRRDAARHPSPNAGVAESAFAGALGVRLGGPTPYAHGVEMRPELGDGPAPGCGDLRRGVRLSMIVQGAAAVLAVAMSAPGWRRRARSAFQVARGL